MATKSDYRTAAVMSAPLAVFIVFATLKLTGVIGWSWWWVTLPIWGVVAFIVFLAILYAAALYICMKRNNGDSLFDSDEDYDYE